MLIKDFLVVIFVVMCSVKGVRSQVPVFDVRLGNLLKMQQGIGWPVHLQVAKGHEALMRLSSSLPSMQKCEVDTPTGLHFDVLNPPSDRFERWSDGCGVRVKRVEASDHGRWRMAASAGDQSLTGWSELIVIEDKSHYTPEGQISLKDGKTHAEVELTTLENSYCLVTQPFSESSLVPGHCKVTIDRTTRAVQGKWNVVLGIPGRVSELQVERNVAVETEQLVSGYKEDTAQLHLYCNIIHTEKNITFCRFQKHSATSGFNIMDGLSDGVHSYYGDGFAKRHCGMTVETPSADDYGTWRCTVGLQERIGTQIQQSTPMQALIRVQSSYSSAVIRQNDRSEEIRTIFVQKGSSFTIMCRADVSLAYCWFQHPQGTQFAPVERQSQDEREFWYSGESLQMGDCGITFARVSEDDAGEWICHMGPRNSLGVEITDKVEVRVTGPLAANKREIGVVLDGEATLYCHTSNGPRPLDYCRFLAPNNVGISVDSSITAENAILDRFYFTPERNLDYGDCSLTIKPVLEEDIGTWTCAALLHDELEESSDRITVYESNVVDGRPLSTAGIVGMAGGLVILALVLAGAVWYKKGKPVPWRRSNDPDTADMSLRTQTEEVTQTEETARTSNSSADNIENIEMSEIRTAR